MLKILGKSIFSYSFTNKYLKSLNVTQKDIRPLLLLEVVL